DEGGGVGRAFNPGHAGGEIDGGILHAGDGAEGFVDEGGTGTAVHAFDVEGGHSGFSRGALFATMRGCAGQFPESCIGDTFSSAMAHHTRRKDASGRRVEYL